MTGNLIVACAFPSRELPRSGSDGKKSTPICRTLDFTLSFFKLFFMLPQADATVQLQPLTQIYSYNVFTLTNSDPLP